MAKSQRLSVTRSVKTTLYPYGIAHRMGYGFFDSRVFEKLLESAVWRRLVSCIASMGDQASHTLRFHCSYSGRAFPLSTLRLQYSKSHSCHKCLIKTVYDLYNRVLPHSELQRDALNNLEVDDP